MIGIPSRHSSSCLIGGVGLRDPGSAWPCCDRWTSYLVCCAQVVKAHSRVEGGVCYELELKLKQEQAASKLVKVSMPQLPARPQLYHARSPARITALTTLAFAWLTPTRAARWTSSHVLWSRTKGKLCWQVKVTRGIGNHYTMGPHEFLA